MGDKPRRIIFFVGLVAGACSGGADGAAAGDGPSAPMDAGTESDAAADARPVPTIEVSGSDEAFATLVAGAPLPTYRGVQGGFHVYLGLRTTLLDPGDRAEGSRLCSQAGSWKNPCVSLDVFDLDAAGGPRQLDNFVALRVPLVQVTGQPGAFELLPRQVTLALTSLDQVDGHRCRIMASVEDASGARAALDLTVTCAAVR